jgi:hypothetical protein
MPLDGQSRAPLTTGRLPEDVAKKMTLLSTALAILPFVMAQPFRAKSDGPGQWTLVTAAE